MPKVADLLERPFDPLTEQIDGLACLDVNACHVVFPGIYEHPAPRKKGGWNWACVS
jgi:hypothetical protein